MKIKKVLCRPATFYSGHNASFTFTPARPSVSLSG